MTATVPRMSPNPKRLVNFDDEVRIRQAMLDQEAAYKALRHSVYLAAEHGASVRALAEFTGMSTNTIARWKKGEES